MNGGFGKFPSDAAARHWRTGFAACMGLLLLCILPVPARASFGFSEPRTIRLHPTTDPENDFFADLRTDGKGTWMVVWYTNGDPDLPIGGDTDILYSISNDDGGSWSAPGIVNIDAFVDSKQDVAAQLDTDGDGNWACVWFGRRDGTDRDIYSAFYNQATDLWSSVSLVNDYGAFAGDNGLDEERAKIRSLGSGQWLCVWTTPYQFPGESTTDFDPAYSIGDGAGNWAQARPLNADHIQARGGAQDLAIGNLEVNSIGTSMFVWSTQHPPGGNAHGDFDVVFSRKAAGDLEWSITQPIALDSATDTADDGAAVISTWAGPHIAASGSEWLCAWNRQDLAPGAPLGNDWDIMISRSEDDGRTWSVPVPLNSNAAMDMTDEAGADFNPFLSVSGGEILAAWTTHSFAEAGCPASSIAVARSLDAGKTWSAMGPLNSNAGRSPNGDHWDPMLANNGLGRWMVTWVSTQVYYTGGDRDNLVAVSSNTSEGVDPSPDTQKSIDAIMDILLGKRVLDANGDGRIDVGDILYLQTNS